MSKPTETTTMTWIDVAEHTPELNRLVLAYSTVFNTYRVCKFYPQRGWVDTEGDQLRCVTTWLDAPIPFSFSGSGEYDDDIAKTLGMKTRS